MNKMNARIQRLYTITNWLVTVLVYSNNAQFVLANGILYESVSKLRKSCKLRYDDKEFTRFKDDIIKLCQTVESNRSYDATYDLDELVKSYA